MKKRPLSGLRVLDCTHVLSGAYCSMMLADLGADVIKIEPLGGEMTRGQAGSAFSPYDFVNRNKRAIAVDINTPEGAEIIRRLARTADIFVENFRPGSLARSGLGYESLSAEHPSLIYASISGFGQTGPYRDRGGLDLVAQAMSGIMSITGEMGSDQPMSSGVPVSDLNAGVFCALGILAAVHHRTATGEGQYVETSLLESAMAYTIWETGLALTTGMVAEKVGTRHRLSAPYESLKAQDGFLVVGVSNEKLWRLFCTALGAPELMAAPEFADRFTRVANRDALKARIEAILATRPVEEWIERISSAGVPCGPINNIAQAIADPQIQSRDYFTEVGSRLYPRAPIVMSKTPVGIDRGAATIGEHTREVLGEAGYATAAIDDLMSSKVIAA